MGMRGTKALRDVCRLVRKPKAPRVFTFRWEERQESDADVYVLSIVGMRDDIGRVTRYRDGSGAWQYFGGCGTSQNWGELTLPRFCKIDAVMLISSLALNDRDGVIKRMVEREAGYKKFTPRKKL